MKKRGKYKSREISDKPNKIGEYWGAEEEECVKNFCKLTDAQIKEKLYEQKIQPAFKTLVDSIYWTYNFHKYFNKFSEQVKHDVLIHLYEKLSNFNAAKDTKAYSYFGTICKNWFIQQVIRDKKNIHMDEDEKELYTYKNSIAEYHEQNQKKELGDFINYLKKSLDLYYDRLISKNPIDMEEILVAEIVKKLIEESHLNDIYNKRQLYVYVKEYTKLPARKITIFLNNLNKFYQQTRTDFFVL